MVPVPGEYRRCEILSSIDMTTSYLLGPSPVAGMTTPTTEVVGVVRDREFLLRVREVQIHETPAEIPLSQCRYS